MIGEADNDSGDPVLRRLFLEALERKSLSEREAFLAEACGQDRALLARILALLEGHREDDFLERPAAGSAHARADNPDFGQPGDRIGRYRLLEKIGEGGCGVVYVAEQTEPVKRRVALKMIKPGLDTRQVVARFEAERQALALMDHPNIARFYDAGVTDVSGQRSAAPANLLTSDLCPLTSRLHSGFLLGDRLLRNHVDKIS